MPLDKRRSLVEGLEALRLAAGEPELGSAADWV
jgi:hypothetical protein